MTGKFGRFEEFARDPQPLSSYWRHSTLANANRQRPPREVTNFHFF